MCPNVGGNVFGCACMNGVPAVDRCLLSDCALCIMLETVSVDEERHTESHPLILQA